MLERIFSLIAVLGLITVSALLLTSNPGVALKTANYVYALLFLAFFLKLIKKNKNE